MGKIVVVLGLTLTLLAGCCQNPGLVQRVQHSLNTVQSYYTPLLDTQWQQDEQLKRAVVAADTTLLLAGELQGQWCPEIQQTEQLELQVKEAASLAQEAGVKAAVPAGD